jgi:hypothetical protein
MEFVIFGLTLLGVALFHRHALAVAIAGLILTILARVVSAPTGIDSEAHEIIAHLARAELRRRGLKICVRGAYSLVAV